MTIKFLIFFLMGSFNLFIFYQTFILYLNFFDLADSFLYNISLIINSDVTTSDINNYSIMETLFNYISYTANFISYTVNHIFYLGGVTITTSIITIPLLYIVATYYR